MQTRKRFLVTCLTAALAAFTWSATADAQTSTGKLTGMVKEGVSGEGLPGVNVLVKDTRRGATTDADGRYIILAIEPGAYTLSASMIGYSSETKSNVRVVAGYTTTVNFSISEAALGMEEMVVTAELPPVEPDKTSSKHIVTLEDIQAVPMVRATTELISLAPGVALDGTDRIRGSENRGGTGTAVGYYIDGIAVNRGRFSDLNTSSIQEVSVLTGGMNAEFGNALAGVVTVVTREGHRNYRGRGEYRFTPSGKKHWGTNLYDSPYHEDHIQWKDAAWVDELDPTTGRLAHERTGYTDHLGHRVELNLGGPLGNDLAFFVSTAYNQGARALPFGSQTSPFNTKNLMNVTYRPNANLKLKAAALIERHEALYTVDGEWEGSIKTTDTGANGRNLFLPEDFAASGQNKFRNHVAYLSMTHSLSPKTFYDVKIFQTGSLRDTLDVPAATEPVRTDADGWFYLPRDIRAYEFRDETHTGLKLDFTSQVNASHLFQAGVEAKKINFRQEIFRAGPTVDTRLIRLVGGDYELGKGVTPWQASFYAQDKLEYGGLIINAGIRFDYFNYGQDSRLPGVELSPMFTAFNNRQLELPFRDSQASTITALSPRVGISHPISDKLAAHYFIGQTHSFPDLFEIYNLSYASKDPDVDKNGNGVIDSGERYNALDALSSFGLGGTRHAAEGVKPEKSTTVEMGLDWNFFSNYTLAATAHYRHDEGLFGTNNIVYWKGPKRETSQVGTIRNSFWISSRGLEASLRKSFSDNISFRVSYDMSWVRGIGYGGSSPHYGNHSGAWYIVPDATYIASDGYWYQTTVNADGTETPIPLTAEEKQTIGATADEIFAGWDALGGEPLGTGFYWEPQEVQPGLWVISSGVGSLPAPKNQERRNQLSLSMLYSTNPGYGPTLSGFHPAGGLRVSAIHRVFSGTPYSYVPPVGAEVWREQSPAMRTDVRVDKLLGSPGGIKSTLFLEVTNLFNERNTGDDEFATAQYGLKGPAPNDPDFLTYGNVNDWSENRWDPRLIQMGFVLGF